MVGYFDISEHCLQLLFHFFQSLQKHKQDFVLGLISFFLGNILQLFTTVYSSSLCVC